MGVNHRFDDLAIAGGIFPQACSRIISPDQRLSDCENDPPEGAALYEVTESISRFCQRKGLGHDRFDCTGLEQRDNSLPGVSNGRLRLTEHIETPDAGLWHDEIRHINGRLTAFWISPPRGAFPPG